MAFIDQQDDDDLNAQNPQAPGASGGPAPLVGAGSSNVGNNTVSQAGVGAGGGGGWTNIQAYLGANKNDSGSSQALNKEVSSQFNKERDAYTQDSAKYTQDAEKQLGESKVTTDQAGEMVKQGAANYDWGGQHKTGYQDNVSKVQGFLGGEYKGPKSYEYGFGADTQKYGNALKDNSGFDGLMNKVYSKNANSPLTSGQFQLQKQLDVNNQNLVDTRSNLNNAYSGLEQDRDKVVTDTTNKLGDHEQDFRTSQNALATYLGVQSNNYEKQVGDLEAAAKAGYQHSYANDQTGRMNAVQTSGVAADPAWYDARGVWGSNLTPEQLQKEQNLYNAGGYKAQQRGSYYYIDNVPNGDTAWQVLRDQFAGNRSHLNQFYGDQDAKYANTADEQERSFNTIQDFLKSDAKRKEQGFKVRG